MVVHEKVPLFVFDNATTGIGWGLVKFRMTCPQFIYQSLRESFYDADQERFPAADQHGGKPPEELAEVGLGGGQHSVGRIAGPSAQETPIHPMIVLEMFDLRLDQWENWRSCTRPSTALG